MIKNTKLSSKLILKKYIDSLCIENKQMEVLNHLRLDKNLNICFTNKTATFRKSLLGETLELLENAYKEPFTFNNLISHKEILFVCHELEDASLIFDIGGESIFFASPSCDTNESKILKSIMNQEVKKEVCIVYRNTHRSKIFRDKLAQVLIKNGVKVTMLTNKSKYTSLLDQHKSKKLSLTNLSMQKERYLRKIDLKKLKSSTNEIDWLTVGDIIINQNFRDKHKPSEVLSVEFPKLWENKIEIEKNRYMMKSPFNIRVNNTFYVLDDLRDGRCFDHYSGENFDIISLLNKIYCFKNISKKSKWLKSYSIKLRKRSKHES